MHQIKHIVLIEDDPITTLIIKKLIERKSPNCYISTFKDGEAALNFMKQAQSNTQAPVSLILLDINMPIMNGWEFLDNLPRVSLNFTIPIIMLTSSIDQDDIKKSKQYKLIKGYFFKPIDEEKLDKIMNIALVAYSDRP